MERTMARVDSFRELVAYQKAFQVAMGVFKDSKDFPPEERYSLTDQIRRSSRSVCSNLAEAWRKRAYPAAFRAKLADAMQEGAETQCWLEFSLACGYLSQERFLELDALVGESLAMLNSMHLKADEFSFKK